MARESKQEINKSEAKEAASVSRKVMNTIRELQGKNGVALKEVKKILQEKKKMDIKESSEHIKVAIQKNMKKGVLVREDGLYKVKDLKAPAKRQASQAMTSAKAKKKRPASSPKVRKVAMAASSARADKPVLKRTRVAKAQVAETPELQNGAFAGASTMELIEDFRNGADSSSLEISN